MTEFAPPDAVFAGRVVVPADKSMSHRALVLSAMAAGTSRITVTGTGADVASTRTALEHLGVEFSGDRLFSRGIEAWRSPETDVHCGNSGTTMRLLCGAIAGSPASATLVGDVSLSRRPMQRVADALAPLGALVEVAAGGTPPVKVEGASLTGAPVEVPIPSAQVRTAVALAALSADGETTIDSPPGFRDHTERWLSAMGRGRRTSSSRFVVEPGPVPPLELTVPGDTSSAAYLWAAAALSPGSSVATPGVTLNPGRTGLLEVLDDMGTGVEVIDSGEGILGDPVGDVIVTGGGLRATRVEGELAIRCLDELPLVAVLGSAAEGVTTVADAGELRVKESDRIEATVAMIRALGGKAEPTGNGFAVTGVGRLRGGGVDGRGDHRIVMAAAVAATVSEGSVHVSDPASAEVSWPGFREALEGLWSSR